MKPNRYGRPALDYRSPDGTTREAYAELTRRIGGHAEDALEYLAGLDDRTVRALIFHRHTLRGHA